MPDIPFLFDSHAHLSDKRFDKDRYELISEIGGIISVFSTDDDLDVFRTLIEHKNVWGTAGVHPHEAKNFDSLYPVLKEIIDHDKVVAIGEIGLDFYYDNSPRDIQIKVFEKQLILALEKGLPVVIHSRKSYSETMDILEKFHLKKVLIHCFSGDIDELKRVLNMGYFISIGGVVTFPNAQKLREVAKEVPLQSLLLETDCPYLAPQPVRGKRNKPLYIKYVAKKIAEIKSIELSLFEETTFSNTKRFFNLRL